MKIQNKETTLKQEMKEGKNGFPDPISAQCFRCKNKFWIKFVVPQRDYSKRNNWSYWSGRKEDKEKHICNPCLKNFYLHERKEFLEIVKNLKKRNNLRTYVSHNYL